MHFPSIKVSKNDSLHDPFLFKDKKSDPTWQKVADISNDKWKVVLYCERNFAEKTWKEKHQLILEALEILQKSGIPHQLRSSL